jgi:glutathione synthase
MSSGLKIAVLMDPIGAIKPHKDTSFAMMLEAQARGHAIFYLTQSDLWLANGEVFATLTPVSVFDRATDFYQLGEAFETKLDSQACDLLLMRKDPPVDAEFIYTTHLLSLAEKQGVWVMNHPQSLRDCNEKLYTAWFAQCCVPSLVSADMARLKAFIHQQGDCIAKPLDGMGGASIFRIQQDDPNASVILETLTTQGTKRAMIQKFIPEISAGDKRILMIHGQPVDFALARIPQAGETRGNLAVGGRGVAQPLSERDRWIAAQVGPALVEKGLDFVGLDVIGDYLTEINVTSPTCVREIDAQCHVNLLAQLLDFVETRLA